MGINEGARTGITTSVVARMLGVCNQTVLDLSKAGVLHPIRAASGWRLFDQRAVERLAKLRANKLRTRVSNAEVRRVGL